VAGGREITLKPVHNLVIDVVTVSVQRPVSSCVEFWMMFLESPSPVLAWRLGVTAKKLEIHADSEISD
jgi:hypothetical protein